LNEHLGIDYICKLLFHDFQEPVVLSIDDFLGIWKLLPVSTLTYCRTGCQINGDAMDKGKSKTDLRAAGKKRVHALP
jgi:hypothetical protein